MVLRRNVLIFHAGALGDFLITLPLAVAMGRLYPQSRILYVTQQQKGQLAERVGRVDFVDVETGWHHLFGDINALPEKATKLLASSHAIFAFVAKPGDVWERNLHRLAPEASLNLLDTTRVTPGTHITQTILDQLQSNPAAHAALEQTLRFIKERGLGKGPRANGDVILHPGAGSPAKCWPAERFVELARRLKDAGKSVRVILGEVERECWPAERREQFAQVATLREPKSTLELLAEIESASLFIGNDSGPGHLAGLLGVQTVSIFGPTDPTIWAPLGPRVSVIRREPFNTLLADEVLRLSNS